MKTIAITFLKERETKNTVRFTEITKDGEPPLVGALYIQKTALAGFNASRATVTIELA